MPDFALIGARARWTAPRGAEGCCSALQCERASRSQTPLDADPNILRASSPPVSSMYCDARLLLSLARAGQRKGRRWLLQRGIFCSYCRARAGQHRGAQMASAACGSASWRAGLPSLP
eukprot:5746374-Pyramimonas_sp.AAC.2